MSGSKFKPITFKSHQTQSISHPLPYEYTDMHPHTFQPQMLTITKPVCSSVQHKFKLADVHPCRRALSLTNFLRLYVGHPVERCEAAPLIRTEDEEDFMTNCRAIKIMCMQKGEDKLSLCKADLLPALLRHTGGEGCVRRV